MLKNNDLIGETRRRRRRRRSSFGYCFFFFLLYICLLYIGMMYIRPSSPSSSSSVPSSPIQFAAASPYLPSHSPTHPPTHPPHSPTSHARPPAPPPLLLLLLLLFLLPPPPTHPPAADLSVLPRSPPHPHVAGHQWVGWFRHSVGLWGGWTDRWRPLLECHPRLPGDGAVFVWLEWVGGWVGGWVWLGGSVASPPVLLLLGWITHVDEAAALLFGVGGWMNEEGVHYVPCGDGGVAGGRCRDQGALLLPRVGE